MPDQYRFASSELRPAERQLLVDGTPTALGARAFDLLVALIERRDRVVDKAELFETVWPGLVVEENNLQVQVSSLRKLLGPNAIATVPGRGYQFVAALAPDVPRTARVAAGVTATNPNNLPHSRTRFIGREKALDDCASLLRDTRLLTLSGIGGCGKTRLAQELAHRQLDAFPDGVWFVDLGPVQEARRVSATVATTMGMKDLSDESLARLAEHLKWRQTLVVLDSCEHVIDAAVESAETLLGSCGALKIVATSREALGMAGEQIFAVRSLSLPATTDLDEMQRSEAVRLFVDHARLVLPDFAVDERNAAAIAEICRRLDGIALAIELAAARVRVLSVDEIRVRLDDRFRLLTGGNRAMPRHQTLHATMQWSHDHLTSREQRLFRRLAVFAGGCTLPAAVDVAGDAADEYDALECLTALHDKSLLMVDRDTQAQPRYRMLETVRQYAEERLNEAGEGDEVRNRHLLHYVALGERAAPDLNGPASGRVVRCLPSRAGEPARRARVVRARGAGRRARVAPDRVALASLVCHVATRDRLPARAGGARPGGGDPDSTDRGEVLLAMAHFRAAVGPVRRRAVVRRAMSLDRAYARRRHFIADALSMAGAALHATGQPSRALASCQEAYEVARSASDSNSDEQLAQRHRGNSSRHRQPRQRRIVLRAGHRAGAHAERRTRNGGHAGEPGVRSHRDRTTRSARGRPSPNPWRWRARSVTNGCYVVRSAARQRSRPRRRIIRRRRGCTVRRRRSSTKGECGTNRSTRRSSPAGSRGRGRRWGPPRSTPPKRRETR